MRLSELEDPRMTSGSECEEKRELSDACFYSKCAECPGDFPVEVGDYGTWYGRERCLCECHKTRKPGVIK